MADQLEMASRYEEMERQSCLNRLQNNLSDAAKATGYCLYCEEPTDSGKRWCCPECRDDWEYEQLRK